jgi:hypothetical protein
MTGRRASVSVVLAAAATIVVCALSATMATPVAQADPLDGPRNAIEHARADSTCSALNYNVDLENAAQQYARKKDTKLVSWPGYTGGNIQLFYGTGDPQSAAIDGLLSGAGGFVRDCRYKDYGVGFVRVGDFDVVSLALGEGVPVAKSATVIGNADVFKDPHDATPDPANGVVWTIGTLKDGTPVSLDAPCNNGWCQVISTELEIGHGYVQQSHLKFN